MEKPQTIQDFMRRRIASIQEYNRRFRNSKSRVYYQTHVIEELREYTGRYYTNEWKNRQALEFVKEIITQYDMENHVLIPGQRPPKKRLNACQRKTRKIEADLAKLAAKAEAFKAKLASGDVIEIIDHKII